MTAPNDLQALTRKILEEMPPETRFSDEDAAVLSKHAETLLAYKDVLAKGFYDTLFAHPPTAQVFKEGERPEREAALKAWLEITLKGPVNDDYWAWQAWVGLIHVLRGVTNPMMIAMWGWVLGTVASVLQSLVEDQKLSPEEARRVLEAFIRLASTITALISESYMEHYLEAIGKATGVERELLDRLVKVEIEDLKAQKERFVPRPK